MNMTLTMGPSLFPIGIRMVLSRSLLLAISVSDSVRRIRLCFRNRSIITKLSRRVDKVDDHHIHSHDTACTEHMEQNDPS